MTPKAVTALKDSIEKWDKIAKGEIIDGGASDCALPHVYIRILHRRARSRLDVLCLSRHWRILKNFML